MAIEQHDYLIIAIITGIIFLQVYIFAGNLRKIRNYKKTIQKANNFEIVEVAVPEDWIKNIEVEEILRDPDAFQQISNNYKYSNSDGESAEANLISEEIVEQDKDISREEIQFNEPAPASENVYHEILDFPEDQETEEFIVEEYEGEDLDFEDAEEETIYLKTIKNKT